MNKNELIDAMTERSGLARKDAERALQAALSAMTDALRRGEKVQLVGFGSFDVKSREARTGRNPKTGEPLPIPAARIPTFHPGKALKDAVETACREQSVE